MGYDEFEAQIHHMLLEHVGDFPATNVMSKDRHIVKVSRNRK